MTVLDMLQEKKVYVCVGGGNWGEEKGVWLGGVVVIVRSKAE